MIKYFIIYSFCQIFSSGYLFRVFFRLQCDDKCSDIKLDGERVLNNKDIVPITLDNYNFPFINGGSDHPSLALYQGAFHRGGQGAVQVVGRWTWLRWLACHTRYTAAADIRCAHSG